MRFARLTAFAGLAAAAAACRAHADEVNYWPILRDAARRRRAYRIVVRRWAPSSFPAPGPGPEATHADGFRPVYVEFVEWDKVTTDILYPLFFYRKYSDAYKWSVLQLIDHEGMSSEATQAGGPKDQHFDVWPFYFSHETGDPIDTYHAVFPIYGAMKYRLGYDRLNWVLFPVYVESLKKGTHTTYVPWPILRVMGGASKGFALWPLVYMTRGPGPARTNYFLWPLIWDNTLEPPWPRRRARRPARSSASSRSSPARRARAT